MPYDQGNQQEILYGSWLNIASYAFLLTCILYALHLLHEAKHNHKVHKTNSDKQTDNFDTTQYILHNSIKFLPILNLISI